MKLKQRIVTAAGLTFMTFMFLCFSALNYFSSNVPVQDLGLYRENQRNNLKQGDSIQLNGANLHKNHNNEQLGFMGLHNSLKDIRAHLMVMRKDLDMSNYSSNGDQNLSEKSKHDKLSDIVLKDNVFRDNADSIVEIAQILQQNGNVKDERLKHNVLYNISNSVKQHPNSDKHHGNDVSNPDILHQKEQHNVAKSKEKVPMHILSFPHHNARDEALLGFTLQKYIYQELKQEVQKASMKRVKSRKRKGKVLSVYDSADLYDWQVWHNHISQFELYSPGDSAFLQVLKDLKESPIEDLYQHDGGTQIKLVFYLGTNMRAIFKPMRYPREQETLPDHFYFSDFERHTAEIAAFNLDLALGFHRVPPVIGRKINVTKDVKQFADKDLLKTFFVSPAGNICFHGQCDYYCDTGHAVCGHPEIMEGSIMAYLPTSTKVPRQSWRHPWRRSYHKRKKAVWEEDNMYCSNEVRNTPPYESGRRLLDLMDMAVFDFLTGNMDRHHYETIQEFGNFTFTMMYDNGRGFGKSRHDEISILAPIYQCCLIRLSTLTKLLKYYEGPKHLSDIMRDLMLLDPITPVLLEPHLIALDRRVKIILKTVHKCVEVNGFSNVVLDDGF